MESGNRIVKETETTIIAVWNGRIEVLPKTPYIRLFFQLQASGEDTIRLGDLTINVGEFGEKVRISSGDRLVLETSKSSVIERILERNAEALKPEIALAKQWEVLCDFVELLGIDAKPSETEGVRGFVVGEHFFVSENGDAKFYTDGHLSHLCIVPKNYEKATRKLRFSLYNVEVDLSDKSVLCLSKMLYILHRRELGDQVFWGQIERMLGEKPPQRLNTRNGL